jgi:hypothetical protein
MRFEDVKIGDNVLIVVERQSKTIDIPCIVAGKSIKKRKLLLQAPVGEDGLTFNFGMIHGYMMNGWDINEDMDRHNHKFWEIESGYIQ